MVWAELVVNLVLCLGDLLSFVIASHDVGKRVRLATPGPRAEFERDA